jgi:lipid-binding SYLF domain-containing protein
MPRTLRVSAALLALAIVATLAPLARPAVAGSAAEIDREVDAALAVMYETIPTARDLAGRARAVLVFPSIVKAGFLFGAHYGEGALRRQGKTVGYYNSAAASYGFQAGVQSFGYALFFMSDAGLEYLDKSAGFEVGVGPSVVVLDVGAARTLSTTTAKGDIYAIVFDQRGLMAGGGVQGSKITRMAR